MFLTRLAALIVMALFAGTVAAQRYPTQPIRIFVTAVGAPDLVSRVLGEKMGEALGQPIVVEARVGGSGSVAGEIVARAAPDGHTLLLCTDAMLTITPHVIAKMSFNPNKDFAPIATLASSELFLAVGPNQPYKTIPEFIEFAKKARPPLAYGSNGIGGQHHLTMEMFKARAGIDLLHVPYKGATPAATAAITGEVAALFSGGAAGPLIRSGRLRALAVAGSKRVAALPEVPTVGEFLPGFANSVWLALCAPRLTPEPVLSRLRAEINKPLATLDVKEKFNRAGGLDPLITTPAEFAEMIREGYEKYGKLVKELGLRVD